MSALNSQVETFTRLTTLGETVTEALVVAPMPLSIDVELAFDTANESTVLCPVVIDAGVAVNDVMVGETTATTVAEHVDVAIVDDASVA